MIRINGTIINGTDSKPLQYMAKPKIRKRFIENINTGASNNTNVILTGEEKLDTTIVFDPISELDYQNIDQYCNIGVPQVVELLDKNSLGAEVITLSGIYYLHNSTVTPQSAGEFNQEMIIDLIQI
jgi:hypothetical protein